jgi:hypothetical protein
MDEPSKHKYPPIFLMKVVGKTKPQAGDVITECVSAVWRRSSGSL